MESVDRVEHSKLSLLHSRPTAIANWIHLPERLANGDGLLLSSCVQLQWSVLAPASLSSSSRQQSPLPMP